ncbi:MAG: primosomal protein N', partial [Aquincola sp.]|nr:primosomal protein N' [Aquincola sp.]
WHPRHPLFAALARHDFEAFAASQLAERRQAGLPPFAHLALLRAEARDAARATAFLHAAASRAAALPQAAGVMVYPPVPPTVARIAGVERMQMLVESDSRTALQRMLAAWRPALTELGKQKAQRVLRWALDVDPLAI